MKKQKIAISVTGGGDKTFIFAGIIYFLKDKYDIVEINLVSGSSYSVPLTFNQSSLSAASNAITKFNILSFAKVLPKDQIAERRGLMEFSEELYSNLEAVCKLKKGSDGDTIFNPIAVDLNKRTTVQLKNLRYGIAAAASFTFPLLFAPLKYKNMLLVDGGIGGNVNLDVLSKHKSIPTIAFEFDPGSDGDIAVAALKTLKYGFKKLPIQKSALLDLMKLARTDKYLMKLMKGANSKSRGSSNFIFTLTNTGTQGLMLPNSEKQKIFMNGYTLGEHIYTKLDYYISTGVWKKVSNLNTIINSDET